METLYNIYLVSVVFGVGSCLFLPLAATLYMMENFIKSGYVDGSKNKTSYTFLIFLVVGVMIGIWPLYAVIGFVKNTMKLYEIN